MDRRTAGLTALVVVGILVTAVLANHAWRGDEFDIPEPAGEETEEPPRGPRVPPDFDLALPVDAIVRYGESNASRATVLYTTDAPAERALTFAQDQLEVRGWTLRERAGSSRPPGRWREAFDALADDSTMGSVVVERGAASVTRVHLSLSLVGGAPFHAPDEPRAWRVIDRAPLPARPGRAEPECMRWLRRLCAELERAGGSTAVHCAMDHRSSCGFAQDPGYVGRALLDAQNRLQAALRAHAIVGSRGARAQTLAQLRVELLGARACLARATRFDRESAELATLIAQTQAEGTTLELDTSALDTSAWFASPVDESEIPTGTFP